MRMNMALEMIKKEVVGKAVYMTFMVNKTRVFVGYNDYGKVYSVTIVYHNRAHQVKRGPGRTFWDWDEALRHYISEDMKAVILHAKGKVKEHNSIPKM